MRFMQSRSKKWIKLYILIMTALIFIGAALKYEINENEKIPLYQIVEAFQIDFNIDPVLNSVVLNKNNRNLIVYPSRGEIIYGGKIIHSSCGTDKNNNIYITAGALNKILPFLLRKRIEWHYENGNFIVGNRKIVRNVESKKGLKTRNEYRAMIKAVVIDPGHGGKDPGGIGYKGIKEKDIVLKVAGYVKKCLSKKRRDIKVLMTRDKDEFISLEKRAEIANKLEDAIYVSIHANVSYNKKTIGYESYYLTIDPQDEIAREVAEKENSVINYENVENKKYLMKIINHIVDLEYRRESIKLAENIQNGINKSVNSLSIDRGVKGAYFYVLKAVKMPSVLIEIGFVTNSFEASHLTSADYQKKLATGIANGINNFIETFEETNGFTTEK
ncbi:MAG: hypothetical protein DRP84_04400 [Spirochaetes bacterium]|nr:MAG: hypothetical protein DRP84_04400 [Spirochaetota bacterium]